MSLCMFTNHKFIIITPGDLLSVRNNRNTPSVCITDDQIEYTGVCMKLLIRVLGSIILCFLPGVIGSWVTYPAITGWYVYLNKPFFSPPNWLFGPVWSVLYLLMAVSFFLIWQTEKRQKNFRAAINIFILQLGLNTAWSYIFFGLKNPLYAFLEMLILWAAIFATIRLFFRINRTSGYLLIPYIAWVSFAALLNVSIILLN